MSDTSRILVVGGAGFIGTNVCDRLARMGFPVRILDDLSRPGASENASWLLHEHGAAIELCVADLRDDVALAGAVAGASAVLHFAAQVAVTSSLVDPMRDFDVNLRGTLQLLEALRRERRPIPLVFTSTNKVYGALDDLPLIERDQRWQPEDARIAAQGIAEDRPLAFCSPYGCSKGGADQYVLDYARTFDMPALVFRMSCIYGPHQHGTEDQGWVAHFLISALANRTISIYGDGKQVRDLLFVDDLVEALLAALGSARQLSGRAYNIGGTPANSASLLEVLDLIAALRGERPTTVFGPPRIGDQRYFASNVSAFSAATGWLPRTSLRDGLARLHDWLIENGRGVARPAEVIAASEASRG